MSALSTLMIAGGLALIAAVVLFLRNHIGQGTNRPNVAVGRAANSAAVKPQAKAKPRPRPANPYRAVSIEAGLIRCEAVEAVEGKRFLVEDGDVPAIPLASCDAEKCTCKYVHHEDRRAGDDRRSISGAALNLRHQTGQSERREKRGRRKSDLE